jgi:tetratricopeptide (TPR) repeat protein
MSIILALVLQVGPFAGPDPRPVSPLPLELQNRPAREIVRQAPLPSAPLPLSERLRTCLLEAGTAPAGALSTANAWRAGRMGADAAPALLCLGTAQANLRLWDEAESAFIAARDALGPENAAGRAGLGAMAGNAALASGAYPRALALLDAAQAEAGADRALLATIALDRARALVALRRDADAAAALAAAREAAPTDPEGWLLSATLSRRTGQLDSAQREIEQAARLAPLDPEVGLEAGLIAVLSGHEAAARRSWQSVIAAAPESEAAQTAKGYIAQLEAP